MRKRDLFSVFFFLRFVASGLCALSSPLDERTQRLPTAPSPAIIFAEDQFWLATYHSGTEQVSQKSIFTIYSSPDGKEWTLRTEFPAFRNIATLAYGNNRFVTIADAPMISTNGVSWLRDPSPRPPGRSERVLFVSNRFVALAFEQIWESSTGFGWERISTNRFSTLDFLDGRFVATAGSTASTDDKFPMVVGTSVDGRSWEIHRFDLDRSFVPRQTAYGNGKFITVGRGGLLEFTTPQDVVFHPNQGPAEAILYTDKFVGAGSGGLEYSSDGVIWTKANVPLDVHFTELAFARGTYLAADGNNFATSTNGVDWVMQIQEGRDTVAYGNGVFVVGGRLYSRDGQTWAATDLSPTIRDGALHFVEGQFLLLHNNGLGHKSTDGIHWVPFDTAMQIQANGIGSFEGLTYAVGSTTNGYKPPVMAGVIGRAVTNGPWETILHLPETPLRGIAVGNGRMVAVGGHFADFRLGVALVSTNGRDWTNIPFPFAVRSIAHGGGKFVVVGDFAGSAVSTNGFDWKIKTVGAQQFKHINYAAGRFVAFSGNPSPLAVDQKMWSSEDGEEWVAHPGNPGLIESSAFGNRTWLFVRDGTVLQTSPFLPRIESQTMQRRGGTFRFEVENLLSDSFLLESSADLRDWNALTNSAAGRLIFETPAVDDARFYRVRLP